MLHTGCLIVALIISLCRSESPSSSHRSSPPISPGCEDQQPLPAHHPHLHHAQHMGMRMSDLHDEFKKPVPPHSPIRPQDFPLYAGGHPYQLLAQGGSAFHRPLDPSGKPIPVSTIRVVLKISEKVLCIHKTHSRSIK